ncbi:MAG: hypothetical protein COU68_00015 [Candidatus Pacebacteria bacterium CG10_big_fil_rev_8_21_14_0_10_45_6]|nr:MAG: hypothetical protein COU68_00015 [Candidatus Pacebacteria bacterium CG10_big_fil_rev_8_21_14_0_10_45_6]
MGKKIRRKIVSLLILLILIYIVIFNAFLHELHITQKRMFPGVTSKILRPVVCFASTRLEQNEIFRSYYTLFTSTKNIIFSFATRGKSLISSATDIFDSRYFLLNVTLNQSFLSFSAWLSSHKCWFLCRVGWWEQRQKIVIAQQRSLLGDQVGSLVAAVALGSTESLPRELRDLFADLGLQHLLAPSGYHLGIFLVVLNIFLPTEFPRVVRSFLLIFASGYLILLTGFRPSLMRAWIMWLLAVLGVTFFRRSQPAVLRLGVTVVLFALLWPSGLESLSFQLSVSATLGILLFGPLFLSKNNFFLQTELGNVGEKRGTMARWRSVFLEYAKGTVIIGCIAQVSVAPLILSEFGSLQLFSPIATVLLAWFIPALLFFGLVIMLFSPVLGLAPGLSVSIFMPVRLALSSIWQVELQVLSWTESVLPAPLAWKNVPDWFYLAWWGSLLLLRLLYSVATEQRRKRKRMLV